MNRAVAIAADPFVPIDDRAKTFGPLLLRADDGTLHSGVWNGTCWAYAGKPQQAIGRPIVAYLPKTKGTADGRGH